MEQLPSYEEAQALLDDESRPPLPGIVLKIIGAYANRRFVDRASLHREHENGELDAPSGSWRWVSGWLQEGNN